MQALDSDTKLLMTFRAERETALREAKAVARAELARRRRRLGQLTHEQEMGVENLIMSTVTKVLEVAGTALESLPLSGFNNNEV